MSEHFDIEKRARELVAKRPVPPDDGLMGPMVQLAREAADARAEEIAQALEASILIYRSHSGLTSADVKERAVQIARSFITKPKEQKRYYHIGEYNRTYPPPKGFYRTEAQPNEPKTREQVLEEALREIAKNSPPSSIARRALEWKP